MQVPGSTASSTAQSYRLFPLQCACSARAELDPLDWQIFLLMELGTTRGRTLREGRSCWLLTGYCIPLALLWSVFMEPAVIRILSLGAMWVWPPNEGGWVSWWIPWSPAPFPRRLMKSCDVDWATEGNSSSCFGNLPCAEEASHTLHIFWS